MSDEALTLPSQNVTLIGAFNPAIFHPEWMRANLPDVQEPIEILVPVPAGAPLLRAGDLHLIVTSERLILYGPIARAGKLASLIVQTLPHTPLRAAGINLQYTGRCSPRSLGPWRLESDAEKARDLLNGEPNGMTFSQVARQADGVLLSLKLTWPSEDDDALLDLNYHLDSPGTREKRVEEFSRHMDRAALFERDAERIRREILRG